MEKPPPETLDIAVGVMIETAYGYKEYCNLHAVAYMSIYPDKHERDIPLYEILVAHREYRCQVCNRLIWDQNYHKENSHDVDVH